MNYIQSKLNDLNEILIKTIDLRNDVLKISDEQHVLDDYDRKFLSNNFENLNVMIIKLNAMIEKNVYECDLCGDMYVGYCQVCDTMSVKKEVIKFDMKREIV